VLITRGAQGIGRGIAQLFVASGAQVVVLDRDPEALHASWSGGDPNVLPMAVDVSDAEAVSSSVETAIGTFGRIDVAVNNAGITRDSMVWKMSGEQWRVVLDVHLGGTFHVSRAVLPAMRAQRYGRIVNVTSYTGLHGNVGQANYAAAKAGIVGFTKTVAKEVARSGITVNAVSPNAATGMVAGVPSEKLAELTAAIPLGRFADPAEIAPGVALLCTEEAGYITGAVLPVDGGMSM
jgi:3-oxoacyl-[acyl-carrier protein] reductase